MKKIFTVLVVLLFTVLLINAQTENYYQHIQNKSANNLNEVNLNKARYLHNANIDMIKRRRVKSSLNHQNLTYKNSAKSNITKLKLDSVYCALYQKEVVEYDINQNMTMLASYEWDASSSTWVGDEKTEYAYDANNNQTMKIDYYWNENSNDWIKYSKYEYTYDENNNKTLEIGYVWNPDLNTWIGNKKTEYTYDENNNKILVIDYSWNSDSNTWIGNEKIEYTYDRNNNQTLEIHYIWNSDLNAWIEYYKNEYTYDENNNKTLEINYNWNSDLNTWIGYSKYENTYDENNNKTLEIDYDWDENSNDWIKFYKTEYSYDANNNQTLEIEYIWYQDSNVWSKNNKTEYAYNENNNMTLEISYEWNFDLNAWIGDYKIENTYDENNNQTSSADYTYNSGKWVGSSKYVDYFDNNYRMDQIVAPLAAYESWNNKINSEEKYNWDSESNDWKTTPEHTFDYYYSEGSFNGVTEQEANSVINIYPNPANNFINIQSADKLHNATFELYNLQGQKVLSKKLDKKRVDVSSLNNGLYFYKINNKSGKLLIQR